MEGFAREERSTAAGDAAQTERMVDLTTAADRLREEIGALTRALLHGSAIEKAEARDRFDIALSEFGALIDETRE
jgi:hypothetical protein